MDGLAAHWPDRILSAGRLAGAGAVLADVNKDGRLDIIAGENWFEAPAWKKRRIREILLPNGYPDDYSNFAMDVNGDGNVDVIACSWFGKKLAWFENPGKHDQEPDGRSNWPRSAAR
jgi:hypothetical protein